MEGKRLIEILINSYQREYPHTRRFKLLRNHQRLIIQYLVEEDYIGLALLYGVSFVKMLVRLEEEEDFERCARIQQQLEELNHRMKERADYKVQTSMIHQV